MSLLNLEQVYPPHPDKGYSLDFFFAPSNIVSIQPAVDQLVRGDDHHPPYIFSVKCLSSESNVIRNKRNFIKANYTAINRSLAETDWQPLLESSLVDECVQYFYTKIDEIVDKHVPMTAQYAGTFPRWYDDELKKCIIDKKIAHCELKMSNTLANSIRFKRLRAQCVRMSRCKYRAYISSVQLDLKKNIKSFWSFVNSLRRDNKTPNGVFLGVNRAESDREAADLYARHFAAVYLRNACVRRVPRLDNVGSDALCDVVITESMLRAEIAAMDDNANSGPETISPYFVRRCCSELLPPLLHMFNLSLSTGRFPQVWKFSHVLPIYKNGDPRDVVNHRPISIIGTISKLFDALVARLLTDNIMGKIAVEQHGFTSGRSTVTNLLTINDYLSEALENSTQVDTVYLDFSKAFDTVNHDLLLDKLWNMGVRGSLHRWLESYLRERSFAVRVNDGLSRAVSISSGVPQGSHLGPILFCIYINDIVNVVGFVKILLYADDVKLYSVVRSPDDVSRVQNDLNCVVEWSDNNGLCLNAKKCFVMSYYKIRHPLLCDYSISGSQLSRSSEATDLGVVFDSGLSFQSHIDYVVSRTARLLGFIKRSTHSFSDITAIIHLYRSLLIPIFTYASQIWSPHQQYLMDRLESIQHRFLRYLAFKMGAPMHPFAHDYTEVALDVNIQTIKSLFHYHDCLYAFRVINGLVSCDAIRETFRTRTLSYSLRNPRVIQEGDSTTNVGFYSALNRMKRSYNLLPQSIREVSSIGIFKQRLKSLVSMF